jgi:hypothetical protein
VPEAVGHLRRAVDLDPKRPTAHNDLCRVYLRLGELALAEVAARRYVALLPPETAGYRRASQQLQECRHLLGLQRTLPEVLTGERPASPAERLEYARVCLLTKQNRAGAVLFTEAFRVDPKLADDLKAGHRFAAARMAAQAGCGRGEGAVWLDATERSRFHQQALEWLQADLAAYAAQVAANTEEGREQARRWMQDVKAERMLACVRDAEALAKLPETERAEWQKLWGDIEAMSRKAEGQAE